MTDGSGTMCCLRFRSQWKKQLLSGHAVLTAERTCNSWTVQSLLNLKLRHGTCNPLAKAVYVVKPDISGAGKHPHRRCRYTTSHMAVGRDVQCLLQGGWREIGSNHSACHTTPKTPQCNYVGTQMVGHFLTPSKPQGSCGWYPWTWSLNIASEFSYYCKQILIVWDLDPFFRPLFLNLVDITEKPNSAL